MLLDAEGSGDLAEGSLDTLEGLAREAGAGLVQEAGGGAELHVGSTLHFMAAALAAEVQAEELAGRLQLFHGGEAMAFVIVVGDGEVNVGLTHQFGRRGGGVPARGER